MTRGVGGLGAANIMKHLKSIHFPADKSKILAHAAKGPGPNTKNILEVLRRIPDRNYNSPMEIAHEISLSARAGHGEGESER